MLGSFRLDDPAMVGCRLPGSGGCDRGVDWAGNCHRAAFVLPTADPGRWLDAPDSGGSSCAGIARQSRAEPSTMRPDARATDRLDKNRTDEGAHEQCQGSHGYLPGAGVTPSRGTANRHLQIGLHRRGLLDRANGDGNADDQRRDDPSRDRQTTPAGKVQPSAQAGRAGRERLERRIGQLLEGGGRCQSAALRRTYGSGHAPDEIRDAVPRRPDRRGHSTEEIGGAVPGRPCRSRHAPD